MYVEVVLHLKSVKLNIGYKLIERAGRIWCFFKTIFKVGTQSIARLRQNLVNCRRNISAYRRPRNLRGFLFERYLAGE